MNSDQTTLSQDDNPRPDIHVTPQQFTPLDYKSDKTNKTLLLLVQVTVMAYILWGLGALFLTLTDDSGVGGIMLIPLMLAIWLLTPVGLVSLILLAIRTKKPLYILLSFLLFIGVVGFFAYDIFVVMPRN